MFNTTFDIKIKNENFNITIDGPSGSGKTSCGEVLSQKLGFKLLDSGKIYRLFSFFLNEKKINWNNLNSEIKKHLKNFNPSFKNNFFYLNEKKIENKDLINFKIEKLTTKIITFKNVRYKINKFCRNIVKEKKTILLGRDAGKKILPEAKFKFYLDASHKIRKQRKEQIAKKENKEIHFDEELKIRKINEKQNKILIKSWDAFYIKNEHNTIEETVNKILKILNQYFEKLNKVGIIGEINVGKSSLFNLLSESKIVIESKIENTTRDFYEKNITWENKTFTLIDTGGMENEKKDFILKKIWERNTDILNKLNVLLWVVNFKTGITKNTILINKELKKHKNKVILIINKTEKEIEEKDIKYWKKIGIKNMIFISVKRKLNISKLKLKIQEKIINYKNNKKKYIYEKDVLILGQTNNGKSSLFNSLLKTEKALTSSKEHTTTNIIEGFIIYNNIKLNFFDTGGIRKKKLKKSTLEKKSYDQILEKIKKFDIALVVLDISKSFFSQDTRIIGLIKNIQKPIILIGNKIDKVSDGKRKIKRDIKYYFKLLKNKEIILTSTKTNEGCKKLLETLTKN